MKSEALQSVLSETLVTQLATKYDVVKLERCIDALDAKVDKLDTRITGELTLVKWLLGLILGGIFTLVLRAFFPVP